MASRSDPPASPEAPGSDEVERLAAATRVLLADVATWSGPDWTRPSLLPGWTRSHVVAHLALNAEALASALTGVLTGSPAPMYADPASRDADIETLAAQPPALVAPRLEAACADLEDVVRRLGPAERAATFERTPGGPVVPVAWTPALRHREVEIHHVDLGAGYDTAQWPTAFVRTLLGRACADHAASGPFRVTATDLALSWDVGAGGSHDSGVVVSGSGHDLAWWLTGRGDRGRLSCAGPLPVLGDWRPSSDPPVRPVG